MQDLIKLCFFFSDCLGVFTRPKQLKEEGVYFNLYLVVHHQGNSEQKLEGGTKTEAMESAAFSFLSLISYSTQVRQDYPQ